MLSLIQREQPFSGELQDAGCFIKIDEYLPVVCAAIHAGNRLRPELANQCLLSEHDRLFEEDPYTDEMISSQPINIVGLDSRFEYDLNRAMSLSTYYRSAWSRKVWEKPISAKQRAVSHRKHSAFYTVYEALISKLEEKHGMVIVFDIHSYNYKRQKSDAPVFNIGTSQIDMERWGSAVKRFKSELGKIELPNLETTSEVDAVFEGRGYLIAHTNARFDKTLVLPTEVKKVFMDEDSGTVFPLVLESLQSGLKEAFSQTSAFFQRRFNRQKRVSKSDMLSSSIEPSILQLDKALYRLAHKIETLKYVNPTNLNAERRRFDAAPNRYKPNYRYRQLPIQANEFKYQLYRLPIDNISDPDMRQLYSDMVNKLGEKVDLLTSVGQDTFLYNSLRYHGRPSEEAIKNAEFLLYAKTLAEEQGDILSAEQAIEQMKKAAQRWEMKCKITPANSLAARAMVTSNPPTLFVNSKVSFCQSEIERLIQHELGVHMATTFNAKMQPLKVFRLGLPGSTVTQEGMAIMAEYKAGFMSHERLKVLATRVLAVDSMLKEQNFYMTYSYLIDELGVDKESAFTTTTRVYRGGGFTKDHLYLAGFIEMLALSQKRSLDNLLIGKCSYRYIGLIDELVERGWLVQPHHKFDEVDRALDPTLQYLIESLRTS
ncbi:flavohemoglobin expression-modulating QEGLA motif protein [Vibrio galatheae]|nr:flavohemoglobin expression-modulating QEGLA motif protein [Vibrio galatheae]